MSHHAQIWFLGFLLGLCFIVTDFVIREVFFLVVSLFKAMYIIKIEMLIYVSHN
jgi:hypothetical protein